MHCRFWQAGCGAHAAPQIGADTCALGEACHQNMRTVMYTCSLETYFSPLHLKRHQAIVFFQLVFAPFIKPSCFDKESLTSSNQCCWPIASALTGPTAYSG